MGEFNYGGLDPIWVAKQESGIVQKLDDRDEWLKVEPTPAAEVEVEDEPKPVKRGRPAKAADADD